MLGPPGPKSLYRGLGIALAHKIYPTQADKAYNCGLRKRSTADGGGLYYVSLVVENAEERRRIIDNIHNEAHLSEMSEISSRYYWPGHWYQVQ